MAKTKTSTVSESGARKKASERVAEIERDQLISEVTRRLKDQNHEGIARAIVYACERIILGKDPDETTAETTDEPGD